MKADEAWKHVLKSGNFKVTDAGQILNLKTKKEIACKFKDPSNNSVAFTFEGKNYSLRKPRAIWLAFNDHIQKGYNVVTKDGSKLYHPGNLKIISNSEKQYLTMQKHPPTKSKLITKKLRANEKAKLTDVIVANMRKQAKKLGKISVQDWCKKYTITRECLMDALTGVTYRHVAEKPVVLKKKPTTAQVTPDLTKTSNCASLVTPPAEGMAT